MKKFLQEGYGAIGLFCPILVALLIVMWGGIAYALIVKLGISVLVPLGIFIVLVFYLYKVATSKT